MMRHGHAIILAFKFHIFELNNIASENRIFLEIILCTKIKWRFPIGIGFGFPTPALTPATPSVIVPPVKPMVINPLISSLARRLGYNPPPVRPKPLTPINFTPDPPPFNAGI